MDVTVLSFGASSLGAEFRNIDLNEAVKSVRTALDHGMNFIDTSPYYGRGQSECLLKYALNGVPRDSYYLCTKLGRFAPTHFDFSAKRVRESIDISLERMNVDYLDIILCHDIEFVDMKQIWEETLPEIRKIQKEGKVKYVGISGYLDIADEMEAKGIGIMNAAPFSARLLTNAELPVWHKATPEVRELAKKAAAHCTAAGVDIAQLALQFSCANPKFATTITGSANPGRVAQWCEWLEQPLDEQLVAEVQEILKPVHNWFYVECLPENSDGG